MSRRRAVFTRQYPRSALVPGPHRLLLLPVFCLVLRIRRDPLTAQTTSILHDLGQPRIVGATITLTAVKNLPPGSLAVLMILLTILLTAARLFAVVADRRRKQAEALNAELANELRERKRAAEQSNRQIAELEARVAERTGQLEAANKESEALSYSVAHDLRVPLRHISGFSTILSDNYSASLDATAQNYLRFVCDGAKNMGRLIDDLLTMGRIGRKELAPRPTDLNLLLRGAVASLQPEYEDREIDWKIGELPAIECHPALVNSSLPWPQVARVLRTEPNLSS
jgi:signal transduction histidine kinase